LTNETNAEQLRIIKTESERTELAGIEYKVIRLQDFDFLIEQAERSQVLEDEKEFFRRNLVEIKAVENILEKENARLRETLHKIAADIPFDGRDYYVTVAQQALKGEEK